MTSQHPESVDSPGTACVRPGSTLAGTPSGSPRARPPARLVRGAVWGRLLLTAGTSLGVPGCGVPEIPESTLRATIERRSFEIVRERSWMLTSLEAGYADARGYLWLDGESLSTRGRELLSALERAGEEGLDPEAYGVRELRAALDTLPAIPTTDSVGRTRARVDVEIRLSTGLLAFARDLVNGRLDPDEARQDWRIEPEPLPPDLLGRVRDGEGLDELFDSLRPRAPYYDRLVEVLATLRDVEARGGWPAVRVRSTPRIGRAADGIHSLRARLLASEDSIERTLAGFGGDSNVYDADLAGAVKRYQSRHGIEPDAVLGPSTVRELNTPVATRIESVVLNLDRLRWLPRDLGRSAILVNVAGFEFALLEDHEPRMTMNVIVGRAEWATRVFAAKMDHLVLNPWWNVPQSILASELLPAARRDPAYLARNGFEVLGGAGAWDGTGTGGAFRGDFRVRQRPGARNALGRVKFMFPNPYDIYLHDTPDDHLFGRSYRAFSHGCIRLERPLELARHIVERHTSRPVADVDRALEGGRTVTIELERPLDVYVVYLTAWVEDEGTSHFYRDIYDRDDVLRGMVALPGPEASTH